MEAAEWYIYQNEKQEGAYTLKQLLLLYNKNQIDAHAYLFKTGWKDWIPLEDCYADLGITPTNKQVPTEDASDRRQQAPRATVSGKIIVHDDVNLVIGSGVNISATGIFVETKEELFSTGQTLKLTCKIPDLPASFNVQADVIRHAQEEPCGYGLVFTNIDKNVSNEIQALINAKNRKQNGNPISNQT